MWSSSKVSEEEQTESSSFSTTLFDFSSGNPRIEETRGLMHVFPEQSPPSLPICITNFFFSSFSCAIFIFQFGIHFFQFMCVRLILMWLHFASSVFGGSTAIFKFELYFGLLVFMGYIVVDTQEIIQRAHFDDLDYVKHALTLFTDLAAIFVRILIILMKNTTEKNERKKKRRD